jgi:23S rRNA-/tRNA-specific pseudouridylate synthase
MANTGLRNEELINELLTNGSVSITTKNEQGIHVFSGSIDSDGIVSGQLVNPKYNEDELKRSVDTIIVELLPIDVPEEPDTVLRVIYNAALAEIELRDETIRAQSIVILDLRAKVQELEIVSQSLRVEIDAKELSLAVSQNETQAATNKIGIVTEDLSNAIQRATAESIQRISLFARNQNLEEELKSLREQLYGKQSEIAEGAKVGENFSAKILTKNEPSFEGLYYRQKANGNIKEWENGPEIEVTNFTDDETITVSFELKDTSMINKPAGLTLQPKESKKITLSINQGWVNDQKPKNSVGFTGDREYVGSLLIKESKGSTIDFAVKLRKFRGSK